MIFLGVGTGGWGYYFFCKDACRHNIIQTLKTGSDHFLILILATLMTFNIPMFLNHLLPLGIHRVHAPSLTF